MTNENTNKRTPLETAIDFRLSWIRSEQSKIRTARGDQEWSAEEHREAARAQIKAARAQLEALRTMPEDWTIAQIRDALDNV